MVRYIWNKIKSQHSQTLKSYFLLGIMGAFYSFFSYSNQQLLRSNLLQGTHICYNRILQSYTSRFAGIKNIHTSNEFISSTEECMSDLQNGLNKNVVGEKIAVKFNNFQQNLYSLHEKIHVKVVSDETKEGFLQNLNLNFKKVEDGFYSLISMIDAQVKKDEKVLDGIHFGIIVILSAFFLLSYKSYLTDKNRARKQIYLDKTAIDLRSSEDQNLIEEYFKNTFEQLELDSQRRLFDHYLGLVPIHKEVSAPVKNIKVSVPEQNKINISHLTKNIANILADKLFTNGVELEITESPDVWIWGEEGEVTHVLHSCLLQSLHSCSLKNTPQKIIITWKIYSQILVLQIHDTGIGEIDETSYKVGRSLMKEMNGRLTYKKILKDGEIAGAKMNLIFKKAPKTKERPRPKSTMSAILSV